jgi:hypothetical protein
MKALISAMVSLFVLNSCVFEEPFESKAIVPVDQALVGCWNEVPKDPAAVPNRMLVLQHSENEYLVQYPVGEKAMFFRAFAVTLAGGSFIQIQLIGAAEGPVKPADRKYHLLKVSVNGDAMEMWTINPDALGKNLGDPARMKAAFIAHKDDAGLFTESGKFRKSQ